MCRCYDAPMARMNRTRIVIALTAAVAFATLPAGRPASALLTKDFPIQPGAPMMDPISGSYCTMNYVFKDRAKKNAKTYIGTVSGCTPGVGSRAHSPEVGAFGTVVYTELYVHGGFALIQIDRNKLKHVSRVVRGFGAAPSGYTTSRTANAGDPLITHGYPLGATHGAQAVTRFGVLGEVTSTRYWSLIQPNIQEMGSPVIRADGMAVGISDEESFLWGQWTVGALPIARYPTVEGILKRLRAAGFNVTL
jgi:hypothetical protein